MFEYTAASAGVHQFVSSVHVDSTGQGITNLAHKYLIYKNDTLLHTIEKTLSTDSNVREVFDTQVDISGGITLAVGDKIKCVFDGAAETPGHVWDTSVKLAEGLKKNFTLIDPDFSISDTGWHHYALQRSGTKAYFFVDGKVRDRTFSMIGSLNNSDSKFSIGRAGEKDDYYFNGNVDELRISHKSRYLSSGFNLASSNYSIDNDTKLLLHFDKGLTDDAKDTRTFLLDVESTGTDIVTVYNNVNAGRWAYTVPEDGVYEIALMGFGAGYTGRAGGASWVYDIDHTNAGDGWKHYDPAFISYGWPNPNTKFIYLEKVTAPKRNRLG